MLTWSRKNRLLLLPKPSLAPPHLSLSRHRFTLFSENLIWDLSLLLPKPFWLLLSDPATAALVPRLPLTTTSSSSSPLPLVLFLSVIFPLQIFEFHYRMMLHRLL
ncbi:hypothetical protein NL676_016763 [Syzygium grande]|nr:hypothetical protein NL676_016763 [Syzygium grande]